MIIFGPVFRILARPFFGHMLLLLGLVEAVFLAESFTTLMERALRYGGSAWDVFQLLSYQLPEILDIALALGVLIGFYFALSETRNRGELVVLATAGVKWTRVIRVALGIGVCGGILSMVVSGWVAPTARYYERLKMAELRASHVENLILEAGSGQAIETIEGNTFITTNASASTQKRGPLFVFQPPVRGVWQANQSRDWEIAEPERPDHDHLVILKSFDAYRGRLPEENVAPVPIDRFTTARTEFAFNMEEILPLPDQERSRAEKLLRIDDEPARLAQSFARAMLVPMAALLACVAVLVAGSGPARIIALPASAMLVMLYDVLGRTIVTDLAGTWQMPVAMLVAISVYLGPPLAYLGLRREAIMRSGRSG